MVRVPAFDKARLAWSLPWEDDWVTAVTFLGTSRRLAAGNQLGQILLWDLPAKSGTPAPVPVRRLEGHTNAVTRLRTTPDGRWLISAGYDHTIRFWDMQAAATGSAAIVLDARARAEAARRKGKKTPDLAPGVKVAVQKADRILKGHEEWILGLSLSSDGKLLVSGDDKGQVIVWDRPAGKETRRWKVKGWVYTLALSPHSEHLLVSETIPLVYTGRYAALKLWDPGTGKLQRDLTTLFPKEHLASAAFSLDGKTLAIGRGGEVYGPNGKVTLVDPATGKKIRELAPGHEYGVTDIVFHPAGKHLASSGRDTLVRIWQTSDGKLVKELGKPRGGQFKDWIHAVAFSGDGQWLAAADMAGKVDVWHFA